jgi:NADH-ubiquinone oxidoreductase chain 4
MDTMELFFLVKIMVKVNFFFLVFSLFFGYIVFYGSKISNFQFFNPTSSTSYLKNAMVMVLFGSFGAHILCFWVYCNLYAHLIKHNLYGTYALVPGFNNFLKMSFFNYFNSEIVNITFSFDFFGFILLSLAYIVGFFSLFALDTRLYWKNIKFVFSFNVFIIIVFLYVSVSNLLLFFLFYECLLIPSFLIVYYISPSRRAVQASLYFVIWTQIGSFLVLCSVAYLLNCSGGYDFFFLKNYNFTSYEYWAIYGLLFLGFGFKVPIWPFHYWLTKTHVEAPAGFSMYLSGFLVKSAIYGFYKVTNLIGSEVDTYIFSTICIIGVIDASLKMWGQTDLKKLVAYGTIQEMNLIFLVFCWGDSYGIIGGILFCFMHAILSTLMFFLVDCVQKRYHSRSVVELSGILHLTPNLGVSILFMCIFYSGVPGTLKFTSEFYIFNGLFEISPISCCLLMLFANALGLIGFSKCWFNVVFGTTNNNLKCLPVDLTAKELFIILNCYVLLIITIFFFNFFF